MPWPKGQADWGYEAIGEAIMSRADLRRQQGGASGVDGGGEEEESGAAAPKPMGRGPRRQEYYQAAVELMQGAGGGEGGDEEEGAWDGPPGFAGEDEDGYDDAPRVRRVGSLEQEEAADPAVLAAERRYRARCRRTSTGLTLAVALLGAVALLTARLRGGGGGSSPDTILAPATLEENSNGAPSRAHHPRPTGGLPYPPPPPPSGEGPIHPPSSPLPPAAPSSAGGAGAGKGKGKGKGKGGRELRQPEIRRATANGLLDTTLHILPVRVADGPVAYSSRAYEGAVPGPTLMLKPGDTMRLLQVNKLGPETLLEEEVAEHTLHWPNTTTIHTHGLHVDPGGIADNIFRVLPSGASAESVYPLRGDHQPGTFYYHPHFHGSSTIQMAGGMAGAIIVEDDPATLPGELKDARDLVCMLQHVNVASGTFRNYKYAADAVYHSGIRPDVVYQYEDAPGNYFIVNGQYEPRVTLRPQEVVRLRLINGGHNDYLALRLPGCRMWEIAADGVYYQQPREKGTVVLVVGSRKDVLVQCPTPGAFPLTAVKDPRMVQSYMGKGTDFYEGTIMHMHVPDPAASSNPQGAATTDDEDEDDDDDVAALPEVYPTTIPRSLPAPDPKQMYQFKDTRDEEIDPATQRFDYVFTTAGKRRRGDGLTYSDLGVNGHISFFTEVQRRVKLGALEEWVLTEARTGADSGMVEDVNHPFHIHVNHFQIVDMSHGAGVDFEVGDWRDSISLPLLPNGNGYVTIRWRADDYTGASLAHCHILAHVDTGMSLTFEVVDGEQQQKGGDGNGAGGVVVPAAMAVGHHGGARGLRA